jgi:hypothetical protein
VPDDESVTRDQIDRSPLRGAIIRGLGATVIIYLVLMGFAGAHHAYDCGPGRFIADAVIMATFGLPFLFCTAVVCTIVILCVPVRYRGVPQLWLAVGCVAALVFFGGFIAAQFSKVSAETAALNAHACQLPLGNAPVR